MGNNHDLKFRLNLQNFAEEDNPGEKHEEPAAENDSNGGLADIIKKQKEMLKNSVSKEDYEKLKKDNETLTDCIINGGPIPGQEAEEEETIDIEKLARHIFDPENSDNNYTFVKNALDYRKAKLESTGVDVFAPQIGVQNARDITENDFAAARKVADVFQQCVDESNGDSGVFTALLQSRIRDDSPLSKYKKGR